jgi:hypothetical protein
MGLKREEIETMINYLKFGEDGLIDAVEFMKQAQDNGMKHERKREEYTRTIQLLTDTIMNAVKRTNIPIQLLFSEFDSDKDGSVSLIEFNAFLQKLDVSLNRKQIKHVFDFIDQDRSGQIRFVEFQKFLSLFELFNQPSEIRFQPDGNDEIYETIRGISSYSIYYTRKT